MMRFFLGPDIIIPASSSICTNINGAVTISKSDDFAKPYVSIATSLKQSAEKYQDHPALSWKVDEKWTSISYQWVQIFINFEPRIISSYKIQFESYIEVEFCLAWTRSESFRFEWLITFINVSITYLGYVFFTHFSTYLFWYFFIIVYRRITFQVCKITRNMTKISTRIFYKIISQRYQAKLQIFERKNQSCDS